MSVGGSHPSAEDAAKLAERKHIVFLIAAGAVLLVAALLRFPGLDTNPPGFWQDEASTGLDAWLLWNTGKDQAGASLPLIARSFGDYPLAGYRYLSAPVVGLLGPTIGNERLVAAIFGTLAVAALGVLVLCRWDHRAALGAMISAALCPTWLHFSRYGSEAILLPAALVLGWAAIALAEKTGRYFLLWVGAGWLGFAAYTYHAVKLFLPLWMLGFLWLQAPTIRRLWRERRRHAVGPALVFALIVLPSVYLAFSTGGLARGRTVLAWYHHESSQVWRVVASNYLSYFDPGMLFVRGGPAAAQQIPGLGMWNLADLVPMIVGAIVLLKSERRRFAIFVFYWFLLGPLPGGVTYETHNMGRAIAWLPAPQIISGIGLAAIATWAWTRVGSSEKKIFERIKGSAVLILVIVGWSVTAYAVYWCTLVRYPTIAQRDFQFDVSHGLLCARRIRKDERLVVSPGFQVGSVFASYLYGDLDEGGQRIWELGERTIVKPGELYVFPAHRPKPQEGKEVCRVVHEPTGTGAAFVYGPPDE